MVGEQKEQFKTDINIKNRLMENAFCRPQGRLGRFGGWLMSLDSGLPAWVLDLLEIAPSDALLEVGSGPGVGLALAAARAYEGWVVGVDLSETMLEMARHRNRAQIKAGRVELRLGSVDKLPFDNATFDAAMTINSLHLWPNPVAGLREVRRILRPGGRLSVAISRFSYASPDKFEHYLITSGFTEVSLHIGDTGTCALGYA